MISTKLAILFSLLCVFWFDEQSADSSVTPARNASLDVAGACLFFKGEPSLLIEWIEWHTMIGISHFYLYEDESSSERQLKATQQVLDYYRLNNSNVRDSVSVLRWKMQREVSNDKQYRRVGETGAGQKMAYTRCMRDKDANVDWLAFIDNDEFLVVDKRFRRFQDALASDLRLANAPALAVRWKMFTARGGYERDDVVTRDPSLPIVMSLRYRLPSTTIKLVVRVAGDVLERCTWLNRQGLHHNCFAVNRERLSDDELPVEVDSLRPLRAFTSNAPTDTESYGVMSLHHYHVRSCWEYAHHILPQRVDYFERAEHIKRGTPPSKLSPWTAERLDPRYCVVQSNDPSARHDIFRTAPRFNELLARVRRHPTWPQRDPSIDTYVEPPPPPWQQLADNIDVDETHVPAEPLKESPADFLRRHQEEAAQRRASISAALWRREHEQALQTGVPEWHQYVDKPKPAAAAVNLSNGAKKLNARIASKNGSMLTRKGSMTCKDGSTWTRSKCG
jgi:Glycosyltransferase family 92